MDSIGNFIDVAFIFDVIVNFMTSFDDPVRNYEVKDPMRIATNYLQSWFFLDIVACLPTSEITKIVETSTKIKFTKQQQSLIKMNTLLKLLRLVKLLRRNNATLTLWLIEKWNFQGTMIRLVKFTLIVSYLMHLIACLWFYLAKVSKFNRDTWVF